MRKIIAYKNYFNEFLFIYDGNVLVVLFNGFKKKTQKLPNNEVTKALRLKDEYYATKRNQ